MTARRRGARTSEEAHDMPGMKKNIDLDNPKCMKLCRVKSMPICIQVTGSGRQAWRLLRLVLLPGDPDAHSAFRRDRHKSRIPGKRMQRLCEPAQCLQPTEALLNGPHQYADVCVGAPPQWRWPFQTRPHRTSHGIPQKIPNKIPQQGPILGSQLGSHTKISHQDPHVRIPQDFTPGSHTRIPQQVPILGFWQNPRAEQDPEQDLTAGSHTRILTWIPKQDSIRRPSHWDPHRFHTRTSHRSSLRSQALPPHRSSTLRCSQCSLTKMLWKAAMGQCAGRARRLKIGADTDAAISEENCKRRGP